MAYRLLRRDTTMGWQGVNHKRVQRLWRKEGLRRPVRTRKRRRRCDSGNAELLRAERPNQVWAMDFQFDETTDGRRLKSLHVVDEHTREALAMRVGRTCTPMRSWRCSSTWSPPAAHPSTRGWTTAQR
jgi:transposase InsO family protein